MAATAPHTTRLAFETHGSGVPVVFLHGLTFDRTTWRPIMDRLGERVRSIAFDLPAHGHSGGAPAPLTEVAAAVHAALADLGVARPIVVGHSMAAGVAVNYAAAYPSQGAAIVDSQIDLRPFVELVQRLEPALRSPDGFPAAFEPFQRSMGLEQVQAPLRSQLLAAQRIRQDLVLGYWDELLRADPDELQRRVDDLADAVAVPFLGVFSQQLDPGARRHLLAHIPAAQLEEWPGRGHFVHLAEPDRFATRLLAFVDHCAAASAG